MCQDQLGELRSAVLERTAAHDRRVALLRLGGDLEHPRCTGRFAIDLREPQKRSHHLDDLQMRERNLLAVDHGVVHSQRCDILSFIRQGSVDTLRSCASFPGMQNYFKVEGRFFFFDDAMVRDTQRAWNQACVTAKETRSEISAFRVPLHNGPWDRARLVGHRSRGEILLDIEAGEDCNDELAMLEKCYYQAGRERLPASLVAA